MTLPRGFKTSAEKEAVRLRGRLGVGVASPLDLTALADLLDVTVVSADRLIDMTRLEELEALQAFSLSAATFQVDDRHFIVTNPLRTAGRLASDVAHELAHLLLDHQLTEIQEIDGVPFRTCRPDEEEQATALGGTLLLPRPLLLAEASKGHGPAEIADTYGVTLEMARFRYNSTGVAKQVQRRSA